MPAAALLLDQRGKQLARPDEQHHQKQREGDRVFIAGSEEDDGDRLQDGRAQCRRRTRRAGC